MFEKFNYAQHQPYDEMTECVDTISKLRTISKEKNVPASDLSCILVRGYAESGDGGGGYFVWDKDLNFDDSGTMIKPVDPVRKPGEADTGCWKRIFDDSVSVKWFGAKGDMKEYFVCSYDRIDTKTGKKIKIEETRRFQGQVSSDSSELKLTLNIPPPPPPTPAPPITFPKEASFGKDDIGKTIVIWNDSFRFITKIDTVHDDLQTITLAQSPKVSFSGVYLAWGTDDSNSIQRAIDLSKDSGFSVYMPPGHYLITTTLKYLTKKSSHHPLHGTSTYQLMPHGLRLVGGGMQVSVLHNEIMDESGMGGPAITLDGESPPIWFPDGESFQANYFSFQYTGLLKDFGITSTGKILGSVGVDMREAWSYTIENLSVIHMGSHAIVLRNTVTPPGFRMGSNTDGDSCDLVHINNAYIFENGGWGIIVDAGPSCISTGRIHIERCRLEQNKGGGIQWTGQGGVIEQCGIYGNGVCPKGARIRWTGQGGVIEQCGIYINDEFPAGAVQIDRPLPIPNAYGIVVKNVTAISDGLLIAGCEIQGNSDVQVMVENGANIRIVQNDFKADDLGPYLNFPSVDIQVGDGNKDARYVYGCHIEDNRIRMNWTQWGKYKPDSDEAKKSIPKHTVVKVNTNALSTVISGWWTAQFWEHGLQKLVELVERPETDPSTGKPFAYYDKLKNSLIPSNTHLQRTGNAGDHEGGHVLLPFASTVINLDENSVKEPVEVDTLRWSKFRFRITGNLKSFTLQNPIGYSTGTILFLEFVSASAADVTVVFGDQYDVAGKKIIVPGSKTVTGILLFDESGKWLPFSPWTSEGEPL